MSRRPSPSPLFPYTTLFRSFALAGHGQKIAEPHIVDQEVRLPCGIGGIARHKRLAHRKARAISLECILASSRAIQGIADRKSTRLNSSHSSISYAVFCLKKK